MVPLTSYATFRTLSLYKRLRLLKRVKMIRKLASASKTIFALIGAGVTAPHLYDYYTIKQQQLQEEKEGDDDDTTKRERKKKKEVLVLPLHRMKIVERKKDSLKDKLQSLSLSKDERDLQPMEIEIKELIDIIHTAARDPTIISLYAPLSASTFSVGGYAHIEELRNAIRVFNESHRVHYEPKRRQQQQQQQKVNDDDKKEKTTQSEKPSNDDTPHPRPMKLSVIFADAFDDRSYFLASAFRRVYLQTNGGGMRIDGPLLSTYFIKEGLEKYGIKVDVFKHGKYKNAPNFITESGYTPSHLENTSSLLSSLDDIILTSINASRSSFSSNRWAALRDYGTLTAANAKEVGLIDRHPLMIPLSDILTLNNDDDDDDDDTKETTDAERQMTNHRRELLQHQQNMHDLDPTLFQTATNELSLKEYMNRLQRKKEATKRREDRLEFVWNVEQGVGKAKTWILSKMGGSTHAVVETSSSPPPPNRKRKIAIVHVLGGINDATACSVVDSLKRIRQDALIKSVILRVDSPGGSAVASELIHAECQLMPQPIICSMSNYAASGGYYVVTNAKRIFALPTTITGSIGVFAIRPDLTKLASQHGINPQHISLSPHAGLYNPFIPLTPVMSQTLSRDIFNIYHHFKTLVSNGRQLSMVEVERRAQGRVYTGWQGREVGLVDEWGGLHKALGYAMREFGGEEEGEWEVEVWPKKGGWWDGLKENLMMMMMGGGEVEQQRRWDVERFLNGWEGENGGGRRARYHDWIMLACDEDEAIRLMMQEYFRKQD